MVSRIKLSVLAVLFLCLGLTAALAQEKEVPLNPNVEYGVLDNGMRYYILKNTKPGNKAEIRLAVNAGSLMETDAQQGLAHFCEHMAFNGSKNFEKNELVSYLQSVGVKFGAHLNAYTSFDETVYMLSIPTDVDSIYATGFQIMEDWAHLVSYEAEEIDKERGVVLEEYRLGEGADKRMLAKYLPVSMAGSRYAERLPIGKKEVLENFDYEEARSFYRDWYRPDLMAIVVVGDIDVDKTRQLIISHFAGIQSPENAPERKVYPVPDFVESRASVASDPEAFYVGVQLKYHQKGVSVPGTNENDYREHIMQVLFASMLNTRFSEIGNKPDAPFRYAYSYYGTTWARSKEGFQLFSMANDGRALDALKTMVQEAERVKLHGFTQSELDRAMNELLAQMETSYNDRDKTESRNLVRELTNHYLEGELAPGIEWEYHFVKQMADQVSLEELNALASKLITDNNKVAVITGPQKEGLVLPDEQEVIDVVDGKFEMNLDPYADVQLPEQIMDGPPQGAPVIKVQKLESVGAELWTLKNGVTVICKKTDLKNDEVLMTAFSHGGTSLYDDATYQKIRFGLDVVSSCGIGEFSEDDISKIYSGKVVSLYPYISGTSEGMNGSCAPRDMEHLFQMIHQYFTAPRKDEDAYRSFVNSRRAYYDNLLSNPQAYYSIISSKWTYNNHPRSAHIPDEKDWSNTDYDLIYKVYKERFSNAADFTFVFVGNFEPEKLKEYCEHYLGALPASPAGEKTVDNGMRPRPAPDKLVVNKGVDQKSTVRIVFAQEIPYNEKEAYLLESMGELLTIKLIEQLREEMSGVYGTSAYGYFSRDAYQMLVFNIGFPCGPENVDTLTQAAINELKKIIENGPEAKDVDKVKQAQRREVEQDVQRNRFWLDHLRKAAYYGDEYKSPDQKLQTIESLSADELQAFAKKYLSGDYLITILMPEEQ